MRWCLPAIRIESGGRLHGGDKAVRRPRGVRTASFVYDRKTLLYNLQVPGTVYGGIVTEEPEPELTPERIAAGIARLSEQDVRIMGLVALGRTDKQIGKSISLGVSTITTYITRMKSKVGLR